MIWQILKFTACVIGTITAVFVIYATARLIFSAWFRTKWEWELLPKYPQSDMVDAARRACDHVFKKPKAKRRK